MKFVIVVFHYLYRGLSCVQIGETIADKQYGKPLPAIKVEEPTVKMAFAINTSPFVGREVCLNETTRSPKLLFVLINIYILYICEEANVVINEITIWRGKKSRASHQGKLQKVLPSGTKRNLHCISHPKNK